MDEVKQKRPIWKQTIEFRACGRCQIKRLPTALQARHVPRGAFRLSAYLTVRGKNPSTVTAAAIRKMRASPCNQEKPVASRLHKWTYCHLLRGSFSPKLSFDSCLFPLSLSLSFQQIAKVESTESIDHLGALSDLLFTAHTRLARCRGHQRHRIRVSKIQQGRRPSEQHARAPKAPQSLSSHGTNQCRRQYEAFACSLFASSFSTLAPDCGNATRLPACMCARSQGTQTRADTRTDRRNR